ncbi:DUF421 domain-containing protein [Sporomusa sp.]|uniref:DUF421 domain-containing protein n=1 Tax=Sporomusa sp. TaxID=2078658 RepID=UPI002B9512A7|nr:DUF421 domain-containing protein [Sporomusa sp.]HWR45377.1 DUF421 domain-containing protein [Sporomusa sp.]
MPEAIEYVLRTSLAFFIVLLLTRTFGQKQLAQMTLFDFVSIIILGALAVFTLVTHTLNIFTGLITLAVWGGLFLLSNYLSLKTFPARKLLEAEPVIVIHNGKILENNLSKTYYNVTGLLEQLRTKNIFDLTEVKIGILEIDGELSILKKTDIQTKNPAARKFTGKELIIDGQIIDTTLRRVGITREWLLYELNKRGIPDCDEVALAAITPTGKLYIDIKDDIHK